AAAVFIALGVSLYFYLPPKGSISDHTLSTAHQDVAPGTNSAIITLPTGQSLHLTEGDLGSIAQAAGLKISRGLDGELRYEIADADELNQYKKGYSIVETPRGGQHEVRLPDGTKIWLNAASSIKFPTT